mgnify:CR=1 FL=1
MKREKTSRGPKAKRGSEIRLKKLTRGEERTGENQSWADIFQLPTFLETGQHTRRRKRQEMHQTERGRSDKTFMSPFFLSANARFEQVNMPFGIWFMECRVGGDERACNHFLLAGEVKSRKGCFGGCPARLASAAIRENSIADSKGRSCALRAS